MTASYTTIWTYPWDLLDEGLDISLGRIADAGLNAVSLAVSYHAGMLLLPHNPKTRVRFLEDGALYFRPTPDAFAGLDVQPRLSAMTAEGDPLAAILAAAERHGLDVVAWTICNHNSHLGALHPELTVRTAFGDPLTYALCPAQPAVQAYLVALVWALGRYPLRMAQLESYGYTAFPHGHHHEKLNVRLGAWGDLLMGLCFCPACQRAAEKAGIDGRAAQLQVRETLDRLLTGELRPEREIVRSAAIARLPALPPYLAVQEDVERRLVLRLAAAGALPLNLLGITDALIAPLASQVAEITEMTYQEEPCEMAAAARDARDRLAGRIPLSIGMDGCPRTTPDRDALGAKLRAARRAADAGVYLYNYGLMPLRSLGWIKEALREG
jgi:hypothetical protein